MIISGLRRLVDTIEMQILEAVYPVEGKAASLENSDHRDAKIRRHRLSKALIAGRKKRSAHFAGVDFADPQWDILLDLYEASLSARTTSVSSLCIAANVPATTALRHITIMAERGTLIRYPDLYDGRRIFIELSQEAKATMERYMDSLHDLVSGLSSDQLRDGSN